MERKLQAIELWLAGMTYREIGKKLGVTHQRAQQMIAPPREVYEAIKAKAQGCCEICNLRVEGGHLHHRAAQGRCLDDFNDRENLLYLCAACHRKEHTPTAYRGRRLPIAAGASNIFLQALLERQGKKGLREFALELGVSPAFLSEVYSGKRRPSNRLLAAMGWRKNKIETYESIAADAH